MRAVANSPEFPKKVGVPQSVGKEFTMGKRKKKYAEGGLAGLADSANALIGEVDDMANTINYGSNSPIGGTNQTSSFYNSLAGFKKGGKVSSASKRADGCIQRGKTKGRMV
jgi:hypothetical protein